MIDRACISLNARCNFKCKYCHFGCKVNSQTSSEGTMTSEDSKTAADNLIEYVKANNIQVFKLGIVGSGEPLLNFQELSLIVDTIANSDVADRFRIYSITNGYLADNAVIDFAFQHKDIFTLDFSLDGYKEINDKYRCSFDRVWENIQLYKNKFGVMPQINATVTQDSIANRERLISFFVNEGLLKVNFSKVFGEVDEALLVTNQEYEEFLQCAKEHGIAFRQATKSHTYDCAKYGRLCGVGRTNIYITKQGIYPCARFWGDKDFYLGGCNSKLSAIEAELDKFTPCPDYQCYYDYYGGKRV